MGSFRSKLNRQRGRSLGCNLRKRVVTRMGPRQRFINPDIHGGDADGVHNAQSY